MNNYKTEGLIIKRTNFGEADRILTILTPLSGKLRIIAKGVRKITSKRSPNLELFMQTSFVIHQSKKNDYVVEAKALSSFENMRSELGKVQTAYQLSELVNVLTRDGQELEEVYDLLLVSFHRLNKGMEFHMNDFKYKLLFLLGFVSEDTNENLDRFIEEIAQRRLYARGIYE